MDNRPVQMKVTLFDIGQVSAAGSGMSILQFSSHASP